MKKEKINNNKNNKMISSILAVTICCQFLVGVAAESYLNKGSNIVDEESENKSSENSSGADEDTVDVKEKKKNQEKNSGFRNLKLLLPVALPVSAFLLLKFWHFTSNKPNEIDNPELDNPKLIDIDIEYIGYEIGNVEKSCKYRVAWNNYRYANQERYLLVHLILGCIPNEEIRKVTLDCYSKLLDPLLGKKCYCYEIDNKMFEQAGRLLVECGNYVKKYDYEKILENFKKVQSKILPECLEKIGNDKHKIEFLANLQILFVFLYLSTICTGALGYYGDVGMGQLANQSVIYFRFVAQEAVERLMATINNGKVNIFRGGNAAQCFLESLKCNGPLGTSIKCARIIFNKIFENLNNLMNDEIIQTFPILIGKLPKNWEINSENKGFYVALGTDDKG
ncbi:MAG: hypothetical protein CfP315_0678 [Candidatus Improbicoccus pseudotrichonymphae]|uniref:Uncharacterized protein n=1 Tax=Candidatus Improbicoccus pseudotrichonymphae TaxID=3033792 RepID=A0AA48I4S3_9FIRM|nr:MAG: hypothetical protein CfP315_0678 [Candidatus Improbicoccus pseudotrichonymphae]